MRGLGIVSFFRGRIRGPHSSWSCRIGCRDGRFSLAPADGRQGQSLGYNARAGLSPADSRYRRMGFGPDLSAFRLRQLALPDDAKANHLHHRGDLVLQGQKAQLGANGGKQ